MKIILALALIVTLAVAAEVIYDGGLGYESGLPVSRGYGGLGGYSGYGGLDSYRGGYGYDGLRGGLRGDSYRGDVIRGDSFRGGLGYGAVESTPWVDYNGDGVVDYRDTFGAGGVRQRSGNFVRADWNGDGVIDANDGWRSLDSTYSTGAWDPAYSTGYSGYSRPEVVVGDSWRGDSWRGDALVGDAWRGDSWRGDGFRGDLGYSGVRSSGAWEVPVERSFGYGSGLGYESGLGGYRSGYGSSYGSGLVDRSWDAPVYGGSYGGYGGSYGGYPVRGGDAWRGDSWRGDYGYEAPRVVQAGTTTQAKVATATKPAAKTTTTKAAGAK